MVPLSDQSFVSVQATQLPHKSADEVLHKFYDANTCKLDCFQRIKIRNSMKEQRRNSMSPSVGYARGMLL